MKDKIFDFKSKEFEDFLNSSGYIIPLIYKDYDRMRGQIASVIAFEKFFDELYERKAYLSFKYLRVEVNQIKKLYTNKVFRDKILFSFNFIQDVSARGLYPLIARNHDICFSKENIKGKHLGDFVNEYAQTKVWATNKNMKYFPKFFKFSQPKMAEEKLNSFNRLIKNSPDMVIGIYYRKDTCPIQTKIYDDIILKLNGKIKFKLYGLDNDIDLQNEKLEVDAFIYTHPNHKDPFPNIIFDALSNSIPVLKIINEKVDNEFGLGSGIDMLSKMFPTMFMYCNIYNILSIPLTLKKYRFWSTREVICQIDYNNTQSRKLIMETKKAITQHMSYCASENNKEKMVK